MTMNTVLILMVVVSAITANPSLTRVEEINNSQGSWTAGHNEITDRGLEHMKRLCGVLTDPSGEDKLAVKEEDFDHNDIPAAFDARKQWPKCPSIDSVKNQGDCGSCWAVAATSSVSDRLCIATNYQVTVNISTENLMCCCSACSDTGGCDGGYPHKAWRYIVSTGLVTGGDYGSNEGCQPYEIAPTATSYTPACQKICTNKKYGKQYSKDLHFDKSAYTLPSKNVQAMQNDILKYGPIAATFDVYNDFFHYQSGVYIHTSKLLVGRHAVRVLGWGTEDGKDYWLVANSWGRSWGEKGLFKILRGTNECNFEDDVSAGLIKQ